MLVWVNAGLYSLHAHACAALHLHCVSVCVCVCVCTCTYQYAHRVSSGLNLIREQITSYQKQRLTVELAWERRRGHCRTTGQTDTHNMAYVPQVLLRWASRGALFPSHTVSTTLVALRPPLMLCELLC